MRDWWIVGEATEDQLAEATLREGRGRRANPSPRVTVERGGLLGRYVVLELLGEGGMGVVYSAYDPELDRKVAIKLLQARRSSDQPWLVREAQALAKLAHPNVVAVHDVGTLPEDRVFVAMEHVDGETLRAWFTTPRAWQEVVRVLAAAGEGLSAAHRAGLVHRDFKPENVLVGRDGRARVMDFGLAQLQDVPAIRDAEEESDNPFAAVLTKVGSVIGTPAYMSPELLTGAPAGPRSDQFAFGMTLYEALHGFRPYTAHQLSAKTKPGPRLPPKILVPLPIHNVAMRAVSLDPEARFTSMDELLANLVLTQRKKPIATIALGVVAAAAIAYAAVRSNKQVAADDDPCAGGEARIAGVWSPAARERMRASFVASNPRYGLTTFTSVAASLDRYASDFVGLRRNICEATEVRHEQTTAAFDVRMQCLNENLDTMGALVRVFEHADGGVVANAASALHNARRLQDCARLVPGLHPLPTAAQRPTLEQLRRDQDDLASIVAAAKFERALQLLPPVVARARQVNFAPMTASLLHVQALAEIGSSKFVEAEKTLNEALDHAARSKEGALEARLWTYLILIVGKQPARYGELLAMYRSAQLAIARADAGDELAGTLEYYVGQAHHFKGEYALGGEAFQRAFDHHQRVKGPDSELVRIYAAIGSSHLRAGDIFEARKAFENGLATTEKAFGTNHPEMLVALTNLGALAQAMFDFDTALRLHERALAIGETELGRDHEQVGYMVYSLAVDYNGKEDYKAAVPYYERALAIFEQFPDHGYIALSLVGLADAREEVGGAQRAVVEAERALPLIARSNDKVQLALARYVLAKALWSANRERPRAAQLASQAREGFREAAVFNALFAVDKWFAKTGAKRVAVGARVSSSTAR